jgi:hypothetical protein
MYSESFHKNRIFFSYFCILIFLTKIMGYKIGDKVKFVNEKGGGVITGILSSSRVNVSIEDGFEIPYNISDLIKIISNDFASDNYNIQIPQLSDEKINDFKNNYNLNIQNNNFANSHLLSKELQGVYFGFVPENQKLLASEKLDIFLINHTEAELLFCIYLKNNNGNYRSKEYGIIESESKLLIDTIEREDSNSWESGYIQLLYYNYSNSNIIAPVSEEFKIKFYKFSKEENYRSSPFFDEERAFIININVYNNQSSVNETEIEGQPDSKEIVQEMLKNNEQEQKITESFIQKHLKSDNTAEVDMHIWEFEENYSKLNPNEIFKIQMNYFNKCLDSALANKIPKVVFIHGVGNGSLKKEIRNKLQLEYPEIEVYDASIAKYGIGATELLIPYNIEHD